MTPDWEYLPGCMTPCPRCLGAGVYDTKCWTCGWYAPDKPPPHQHHEGYVTCHVCQGTGKLAELPGGDL